MDKLERVARAIAYSGAVPEHREWEELLPETRRHYLQQAQAAIAALEPVTVQEMPEVLTSEQLADACLWHRHDYGIVSKGEQEARRRNASDWWRAFQRALAEREVE